MRRPRCSSGVRNNATRDSIKAGIPLDPGPKKDGRSILLA
jgi:hypothetical protein